MIIHNSAFTPYQLPLTRPWISHQGNMAHRSGWLIKLQSDNHQGIGDCAPLAEAGTETADEAQRWLTEFIPKFSGQKVEESLASLDSHTPPPAARCGIEAALIDLLAQEAGLSMAQWLNGNTANKVMVNTNLGQLDETTIQRLTEAEGYAVIKLKVGMAPIEQELAWLQQLAEALPQGIRLRLDANRAWSYEQASTFLSAITALPIESIEEPLINPSLEQLHQLQQATQIPLALDESLGTFDLERLWRQPVIKRITLKPMVWGGLLPSLKVAHQAFDAGMDVVVTTTVDSAVGVWAATALAAALGKRGEGLAHGLATSQWLTEDVAEPPHIRQGIITLEQR